MNKKQTVFLSALLGIGSIMMLSFLIISAIKADSGCTVSDDLVVTGDLSFDGELKPDGSTCSNGQILKKTGTDNWDCADDDTGGGGDITSVIAGTGLSDGGTSGDVTLNADTSYLQRRVSSTCTAGSSIREIKEDGTVVCDEGKIGGSVMYLRRVNSNGNPANCPSEWTQADYQTECNGNHCNYVRTCYRTDVACQVMYLRRVNTSGNPANCPSEWTQADYRTECNNNRCNYVRTCYKCP